MDFFFNFQAQIIPLGDFNVVVNQTDLRSGEKKKNWQGKILNNFLKSEKNQILSKDAIQIKYIWWPDLRGASWKTL